MNIRNLKKKNSQRVREVIVMGDVPLFDDDDADDDGDEKEEEEKKEEDNDDGKFHINVTGST